MISISKIKLTNPSTPQYPLLHIRCTHQSMPIWRVLSVHLSHPVQTVGTVSGNLQGGNRPEHYIHCNGTQLKLADNSIFGQEEYQTSDHYVWNTDKDGKLLFIFPTSSVPPRKFL